MGQSDWLLREPKGTMHVTKFVPAKQSATKTAFVLPACWSIYEGEMKAQADAARTRLRRRLRPVRADKHEVTCMLCIGLGYA